MAITKNLVTLMGGTISVKSQIGKEITLTVELDFKLPEGEEDVKLLRQPALESLKVLVSDIDRTMEEMARGNFNVYPSVISLAVQAAASLGTVRKSAATAQELSSQSQMMCAITARFQLNSKLI